MNSLYSFTWRKLGKLLLRLFTIAPLSLEMFVISYYIKLPFGFIYHIMMYQKNKD